MPTLSPQLIRSRIGRICVAIIGETVEELLDKAANSLRDSNFLEFRLDYVPQPSSVLPGLKQFLAENPTVTAIATCRRVPDGGRFAGKLNDELETLVKAAESGFQLVDLPLESAEALKGADLQRLRDTGVSLILSHHDFTVTKDLDGIYRRAEPFKPDFFKIVPTAKTLSDNLTLIRFLEKMADSVNIVGICMGDAGVISRVLGVRAGSAFTFASAGVGEETAPGQIAARTLTDVYRIDQVDTATKIYGVAGNPVRSSLSPLMLNAAFRRETVNAVYLALQTNKLVDLLKLVQEIPIQGLSVTMPLKREIVPHLERTDPLTAKIGACNTVRRAQDGNLYGFNTDVAGILVPLEKRMSLHGAKVLVLGAGGAARAAVFALRSKGSDVFILNRTPETAQKLAKESGSKAIKRELLPKQEFDLIVNATPVGMSGQKAVSPLTVEEARAKLIFDLVYNPMDTPLLRMARQNGINVITGVEMFVQQGARQFEIWTGRPAPEEEMFRVVLHALRQQTEAAQAAESPLGDQNSPAATKKQPDLREETTGAPARSSKGVTITPKNEASRSTLATRKKKVS